MLPNIKATLMLVLGVGLLLEVGCQRNRISKRGALGLADGDQNADDGANNSNTMPEENEEGKGLSLANTVRFKKQNLIKNDLESALALSSAEICKELGTADCLSEVHHLALGGVDAYKRGVFAGITESMMTSPIALERIALAGCSERAKRDVRGGENEIFRGMSLDGAGNLAADGRKEALAPLVLSLYTRFLGREPADFETDALVEMYDEIAREKRDNQAFEWARLSCYAVATNLEFVFY